MIYRSAKVRYNALDVTLTVIFIANIFLKLQVCDWFRAAQKTPENAKNMFDLPVSLLYKRKLKEISLMCLKLPTCLKKIIFFSCWLLQYTVNFLPEHISIN